MPRFALALSAVLAAVASVSASTTCPTAAPVFATGGTGADPLYIGDTFSLEFIGFASQEWYKVEVASECDIVLAVDNCSALLSSPATINVYDECNGDEGGPLLDTATENCDDPGNVGAEIFFEDPENGPKTYYISVSFADGTTPPSTGFTIIGRVEGANGQACGDPHFNRWGRQVRDSFHGECDMVLFHQEEVEGKDLDVHVRTTIKDSYSYISGVGIKYGEEVIEFQHDAMFVNGAKAEDESQALEGGAKIVKKDDDKKRRFKVGIQDRVYVEVWSTKSFMGVSLTGAKNALAGSNGILGDYETGDMIARDGSLMDDFQDFGFEWQVSPSDPKIFLDAREPQLPYERCRMPSMSAESRRRKLRGQDRKLFAQAMEACTKNHIPENVQSCVDDVMFTGEIELAEDF